jgi:hypothetical protein
VLLLSGRTIIERVRATVLAFAGLVVVSLLVSACGGSPVPVVSAGSAHEREALAYSRCMRSHGVTNFPDPDSAGNFPPLASSSAQAKQASLSAQEACKSLLASGGGGGGAGSGDQLKLSFALQVARCMRAHGFPTYPDPTTSNASSQGSGTRFDGTGIDIRSPRFQTAETNCEKQVRETLGLP